MSHNEGTTRSEPLGIGDEPGNEFGEAVATVAPRHAGTQCRCGQPGGRCVCGALDAPALNGGASFPYVYAIGRIEARFPSLGIEKEVAQVIGRTKETKRHSHRQVLHRVLTEHENRYLARQLCYVFKIEGLETYLLQARDPTDVALLVEAMRSEPSPLDIDVVIGLRGPIAQPDMCNGLSIPIVLFDHIYSFDRDALLDSIPRPEGVNADEFRAAAEEMFDRVIQLADNAGATDADRALNYLSVRYPEIYGKTADQLARDASLTAVDVRSSQLSTTRQIVEVIFSYTHRQTDVTEKFFVRVDVSDEFPFLVTKLSPYYDR